MARHPWLDFTRPVPLEKLPDWNTFIAGEIKNEPLRAIRNNVVPKSNKTNFFIICFIIVIAISIIVIVRL